MYIGTQPYSGIRARHTYTATAGQTSFSGAGAENVTLTYADELYIDVYQNGVKLSPADYTATSGTTVVLGTGATVSDIIEVIKYDAFSVADTVSAKDGGGFGGNISTSGTLDVTGAITSSAGATITTADNSNNLTLISTDADASTGPNLVLQRDSSSPADNDLAGTIKFLADNDAGQATDLVSIFSKIIDASDGTEDASLLVNSIVGGSQISRLNITPTEIAINEDSIDSDFRVESNGNANMINVDGGNDRVGIGMVPDTTTLTVNGQVGTTNGSVSAPAHTFYSDADTGMFRSGANEISFANGGATKQRITSTGSLVANGVSASTQSAGAEGHFVSLNDGSKYGMISGCDNIANRDAIVFTNPNGLVGTIKTNGSSTSYNTSSDYRLKENVSYNFDATSRLKQLKPARFNFIADANTTVDGFLAHEVSSIVPEAISGTKDETKDIGTIKDKDGVVVNENVFESAKEDGQTWEKTGTKNIYQNIDQSKLVPLLVKSLQEALTKIEVLEADVKTLKGE